jgi:hypothetical protein
VCLCLQPSRQLIGVVTSTAVSPTLHRSVAVALVRAEAVRALSAASFRCQSVQGSSSSKDARQLLALCRSATSAHYRPVLLRPCVPATW